MPRDQRRGLVAAGLPLLVGAVLCEASYVVIGKKLAAKLSPKRISALINLWGLLLVTPLGLWQALSFDFGSVSAGHWWLLLFYSLAASMVTVWLWMRGLAHVPEDRQERALVLDFTAWESAVLGYQQAVLKARIGNLLRLRVVALSPGARNAAM